MAEVIGDWTPKITFYWYDSQGTYRSKEKTSAKQTYKISNGHKIGYTCDFEISSSDMGGDFSKLSPGTRKNTTTSYSSDWNGSLLQHYKMVDVGTSWGKSGKKVTVTYDSNDFKSQCKTWENKTTVTSDSYYEVVSTGWYKHKLKYQFKEFETKKVIVSTSTSARVQSSSYTFKIKPPTEGSTLENYTFLGWDYGGETPVKPDDKGYLSVKNDSESGTDIVYVASFEENWYGYFELKYNANGHGTDPKTQKTDKIYGPTPKSEDASYTFTTQAVMEDIKTTTRWYISDGWYNDSACSVGKKVGATRKVSAPADTAKGTTIYGNVYAKWSEEYRYTIDFWYDDNILVNGKKIDKILIDAHYLTDTYTHTFPSQSDWKFNKVPNALTGSWSTSDDEWDYYNFTNWKDNDGGSTQKAGTTRTLNPGKYTYYAEWQPTEKEWYLNINYNNGTSSSEKLLVNKERIGQGWRSPVVNNKTFVCNFINYNDDIANVCNGASKSHYHALNEFHLPSGGYNKWSSSLGQMIGGEIVQPFDAKYRVQIDAGNTASTTKDVYIMWEQNEYYKFTLIFNGSGPGGDDDYSYYPCDTFGIKDISGSSDSIEDDFEEIFERKRGTSLLDPSASPTLHNGSLKAVYYIWGLDSPKKTGTSKYFIAPKLTKHEPGDSSKSDDELDYKFMQQSWTKDSSFVVPGSQTHAWLANSDHKYTGEVSGTFTLNAHWKQNIYHTCTYKPVHNMDRVVYTSIMQLKKTTIDNYVYRVEWENEPKTIWSGAHPSKSYVFHPFKEVHLETENSGTYFLEKDKTTDYRPDGSTKTGIDGDSLVDRDLMFDGWLCNGIPYKYNSDNVTIHRDKEEESFWYTDHFIFTGQWKGLERLFELALDNNSVHYGNLCHIKFLKGGTTYDGGTSISGTFKLNDVATDQISHRFKFTDLLSSIQGHSGEFASGLKVDTTNSAWDFTGWNSYSNGKGNWAADSMSYSQSISEWKDFYHDFVRDSANKTTKIFRRYYAIYEHKPGIATVTFYNGGIPATNMPNPNPIELKNVRTQTVPVEIPNNIPTATGVSADRYVFDCWHQRKIYSQEAGGPRFWIGSDAKKSPGSDDEFILAGVNRYVYNWDYNSKWNFGGALDAQWWRTFNFEVKPEVRTYFADKDSGGGYQNIYYSSKPYIYTYNSSNDLNIEAHSDYGGYSTKIRTHSLNSSTSVSKSNSSYVTLHPGVQTGYMFREWNVTITKPDGTTETFAIGSEDDSTLIIRNAEWYNSSTGSGSGTIEFGTGNGRKTTKDIGDIEVKSVCQFLRHEYKLLFYNCVLSQGMRRRWTGISSGALGDYTTNQYYADLMYTLDGKNTTSLNDYSYTFQIPSRIQPPESVCGLRFKGWKIADNIPNRTSSGEPSGNYYNILDDVVITIPQAERADYSKPYTKKLYAIWYADIGVDSGIEGTHGIIENTNGANTGTWECSKYVIPTITSVYDGRMRITSQYIVGYTPTKINGKSGEGAYFSFTNARPVYSPGETLEDSYYYWEGEVTGSAKFYIQYSPTLSYKISGNATGGGKVRIEGVTESEQQASTYKDVSPLSTVKLTAIADEGCWLYKWVGTYYDKYGVYKKEELTSNDGKEYITIESKPAYSNQVWTAYFKTTRQTLITEKVLHSGEGEWTWDKDGGMPSGVDAELDFLDERTMIKQVVYGDNDFKLTPWQEE